MINKNSYTADPYFIALGAVFLIFLAIAISTSLYWLAAIPFAILLVYFGWQQWRSIFFLLIFSLPWSFEYNFNSSLGTDLPDEPLMWLMSLLFVAYLVSHPSRVSSTWRHPIIYLLFFYFGWMLVTLLFSTEWVVSLKFLLAKCWYLIAFVFFPLLIFKNRKPITTTALIFLISMLLVVLISLCRHALLGFAFVNINDAVSPFFRNHVNYSAMLVCTIPILIAIWQLARKYRPFITVLLAIVLTALFFSYSRGAWLAFIIGMASYWLIAKKKLFALALIAGLLIIVFALWIKGNDRYLEYAHDYRTTTFHTNFEEHLVATYKLKDVSTAERFNRWIAGVRMIKENWLTGFGPNTFYHNYKPYSIPAFKTWVSDNKDHSTIHNYFLLVLIEQGVPGALFFLMLTGAMLYYAERLYHRVQDRFYKVIALACGVMIMMIIVVNLLSDLIETDKVGSLFFLCLATLVSIDLNTRVAAK